MRETITLRHRKPWKGFFSITRFPALFAFLPLLRCQTTVSSLINVYQWVTQRIQRIIKNASCVVCVVNVVSVVLAGVKTYDLPKKRLRCVFSQKIAVRRPVYQWRRAFIQADTRFGKALHNATTQKTDTTLENGYKKVLGRTPC